MESKKNNTEKQNDKKESGKKPYSSPKLISYGNVVDLTQGTSRKTKETTRRA